MSVSPTSVGAWPVFTDTTTIVWKGPRDSGAEDDQSTPGPAAPVPSSAASPDDPGVDLLA